MPNRLIEAAYFHYQRGASNKVYELFFEEVVSPSASLQYVVRANYGRTDSVLKPIVKYRGADRAKAVGEYNAVFNEKVVKGYRLTDRRDEEQLQRAAFRETPVRRQHHPKPRVKATLKPVAAPPPSLPTRNITLEDL